MSNPKKKFTRNGQVAEIVQLTFHGWFGNLIDRIKGKTTEKDIGMYMIDRIEDRFGINESDTIKWREEMKEKEREDFEDMQKQADLMKQKPFQRDESGQITSPFTTKRKGL